MVESPIERIKRLRFHSVVVGDIAVYANGAASRVTRVDNEKELFATGDMTWANEITFYRMKDGSCTESQYSPVIAIVQPEHLGWQFPEDRAKDTP